MRLEAGKNLLGIEGEVAWATPGTFTVHNFPCSEDGKNCVIKDDQPVVATQVYQDPSQTKTVAAHKLLGLDQETTASTKRRHVRA